jgi:hypothetical protein
LEALNSVWRLFIFHASTTATRDSHRRARKGAGSQRSKS